MKRNLTIEACRFLIILWIVLYHYTHRYFDLFSVGEHLSYFSTGGTIGVPLFFLISGYFSGKVLIVEQFGIKVAFKFFVNKYWRLWPAYVVSIIIIFIFSRIFPYEEFMHTWQELIANVFIYHPGFRSIDGAHWFIADLVKLFVLLSFFFLLKKQHRKKYFVSFFIIIFVLYVVNCVTSNSITNSICSFWPCRSTLCFASGMILYNIEKKEFPSSALLPVVLFFLFESIIFHSLLYPVCVVLLGMVLLKKINIKLPTITVYLGTLSYYIYLIHQNIGYIIINRTNSIILAIAVSVILSVLMERLLCKVPARII